MEVYHLYKRAVSSFCLLIFSISVSSFTLASTSDFLEESMYKTVGGKSTDEINYSNNTGLHTSTDILLDGVGPSIAISRSTKEGVYENNLFGSWSLDLTSISVPMNTYSVGYRSQLLGRSVFFYDDEESGKKIHDAGVSDLLNIYQNLCANLVKNSAAIKSSPYLITPKGKEGLVLDGSQLVSLNTKWRFDCEVVNEDPQLTAYSPGGLELLFKPFSINQQQTYDNYISQNSGEYPVFWENKTVLDVLDFYLVKIEDKNGEKIIFEYDTEVILSPSSFRADGVSDYKGTGLCEACNVRLKTITSDDGRFINLSYQSYGGANSVIDFIDYGIEDDIRTIDYSYLDDNGVTYLTAATNGAISWAYDYSLGLNERFTSYRRSNLFYRRSQKIPGSGYPYISDSKFSYKPLSYISNNMGYSATYEYMISNCNNNAFTSKPFKQLLSGATYPSRVTKVEKLINGKNDVELLYLPTAADRGSDCFDISGLPSTPKNEYLRGSDSRLSTSSAYRTVAVSSNGLVTNRYFSRLPKDIDFRRLLAEEKFLNGNVVSWNKNHYQELDNDFNIISEDMVDYTPNGFIVLGKIETDHKLVEYNYSNNYNTTGDFALLDHFGNPSRITFTAKNVAPLVNDGLHIPSSEIRFKYDYIGDYGFYLAEKRRRYNSKLGIPWDNIELAQELDSKFNKKFEVSNGVTTTYHYDGDNHLQYKDVGSFNTYTLNDPSTIPAENSNDILRTTFSNYHFGKPWLITHSNDLTTEYEFNVFGEKLYEKDTAGIETRFDYVDGLLKTKRNLSSYYSDVSYDYIFDQPHGYTATETYTDILGDIVKTTKFNGASKPVSIVVSGVGDPWYKTFEYDAFGNTTFESVISQNATSSSGVEYKYDGLNRLLERATRDEDDGSTLEESICYGMGCESKDSNASSYGNFKIITKKTGETVYDFTASLDQEFVYEKQVNPNGLQPLTLQYTYMGNGLPQAIDIDDGTLNKAVSLAYWTNSTQLRYYDDYETPKLSYQYNAQGELNNVSNTLDGGSYSQIKTYSDGILDFITYGDEKIEEYEYYPNGRLKYSEVDGNKHSYTYDDDGYLEFEEFEYPDSEAYKISYKYNQLGSLKEYTLPNDKVVTVNLDAIQGIESLISDDVNLTFKQKAQNRLQEMFYGEAGDSIENVFDALLRLDDVNHNQYSASNTLLDLDYDTSKGLVSDYINPQSAQSYEIDYDDKGRLSNVIDKNNVNHGYTYQFMSDLNEVVRDSVVQDYEYAEESRYKGLVKYEGGNISYDENANIDGFAGAILKFDSRNLLTDYSNGALSSTYSYFAEGSRASEKIGNSSDIREIRSSALGSLVYTDNITKNRQEELFYFNNQLMARNTICADTDGDGLNDCHEDALGTDKNIDNRSVDTDGDGIYDLDEIEQGLKLNVADSDNDLIDDGIDPNPTEFNLDEDGDYLSNALEIEHGTDPVTANFDQDGDGVLNIDEYYYYDPTEEPYFKTDPFNPDTDGDGLNDSYDNDPNHYESDVDGDGLSNTKELNVYFTDPYNEDTDGDDLPDKYEVDNHANPIVDVGNGDHDFDGLYNYEELRYYETDPLNYDTDNDGISDGFEVDYYGSNPLYAHSDNDGLEDGFEVDRGLNPTEDDTDNDGLNDDVELQLGTDALKFDTDNDGLGDAEEIDFGSDPLKADTDGDGLNDYGEYDVGSDPLNTDTDGDGLNDGYDEYPIYNEPDVDNDGLSNADEVNIYFTDPYEKDTDSDGLLDLFEVNNGTNPLFDVNNGDYDLDGVDNRTELRLGLDPLRDFSNGVDSDYSVFVIGIINPILINILLM